MKHDGKLNIAVGMSAKTRVWKNKSFTWSGLVARLSEEHKTNETAKEYASASKEDRHKIKDVGGYVGGYLRNGRRNPKNVVYRQLLTLDVDFAKDCFWDDFTFQFDNAAVLHVTHTHTPESPRLRLIMPLNREVTPDEYVAIGRQIAGLIGIDLFDNTTFETNRLMFWPSNPKDVEYYFEVQDGAWLDADAILATYPDWRDTSLWPTAEAHTKEVENRASKQEDPETKKGIVGAFCRTYSITEAIEKYLSDVYVPTDIRDRYTYLRGSAAAGLIVYDDTFAFSHHGTDPCGGKLCNSFDLVRLHLYGDEDGEATPAGTKPKSFKAMEDLARRDNAVKLSIAKENIVDAKYEFSADPEDDEQGEDEDLTWTQELEVDVKGGYLSSASNLNLILRNDRRLKDALRLNDFDGKRYAVRSMPWRQIERPEPFKNVDYSGVRNYIESIYSITASPKIDDALALEFERNRYHPILDYLNSLEWDGEPRLDTLLIDFLGTENSVYYKEIIRKMLVGAVARVKDPGCKFELVLTLIGAEGVGKSTLVKKLGGPWFSDSFHTMRGKESFEQLQGSWIIEMAELSGLKKTEIEAVKHYISKQEDTYRPAYGRVSETFKRQCIFIGSTNEPEFLKGSTGNRRFLPVDAHPENATKNVWDDLDQDYIDQVWAEAVYRYEQGETLYLSDAAKIAAFGEQQRHTAVDDRLGIIEEYLDTLLPEGWESLDIYSRREFFGWDHEGKEKGTVRRREVCIAEIWCECLARPKEDMDRYKTREVNEIMRGLKGWRPANQTKYIKPYGKQKYYTRTDNDDLL